MNEQRYPTLAKLLSKRVKSAAQVDVDELRKQEKELKGTARKLTRILKVLETYMNVPTKVALMPSEISLFAHSVWKEALDLEKHLSDRAAEDAKTQTPIGSEK